MDSPADPQTFNETIADNDPQAEIQTESSPCTPEEVDRFKTWHSTLMLNIFNYVGINKYFNSTNFRLIAGQSIIQKHSELHMYPLRLSFEDRTLQTTDLMLIVKKSVVVLGHIVGNISQLHNEIIFYQMYVQPGQNFPRCFYSAQHSITELVLVLENVKLLRYYANYPFTRDPTLEYTLTVMRELGRFHGKGYVMKERRPEVFAHILSFLRGNRINQMTLSMPFINMVGIKEITYLCSNDYDAAFCKKVAFLMPNLCNMIPNMTRFPDFLYTLCHGDLILSNILFKRGKYQQNKAMLIDFGFVMHASPSFDIAMYICLYCSTEQRNAYFETMLKSYHDGVHGYLFENGIENLDRYSHNVLLDDYRKNAIFGAIMAVYYLPVIMEVIEEKQLKEMSVRELILFFSDINMDLMLKRFTDILQHLDSLGCLGL